MYAAPSDDQVLAILARHNLPPGLVEAGLYDGSVNHVRLVGDVCVRILKEEDFASDLYTEVVSVPALREIGVATPELIFFDETRDIVPGLVTIYRRIQGIPLGRSGPTADPEAVVRKLGVQIARWLVGLTAVDDPNRWLDKPHHDDIWKNYRRNVDRISVAERSWVEETIERLEKAVPGAPSFVHWDLHANNIFVHQGEFAAILDWGDAGWGDPSLNYHCLPADWLPILLEPFETVDHDLLGRCLYGILAYALNDIHRDELPNHPYANTGHRRWRGLQKLAQTNLPDQWRDWLGDGPPG